MDKIRVKKNNKLLEQARELRRNMTPQEKHLWYDYLRHYPIKIYKQRIIDNFIVDFYCNPARLVIEVDGSKHFTPEGKAYDRARTQVLEQYDLFVLRISDDDVDYHFDHVCRTIDETIKMRIRDNI